MKSLLENLELILTFAGLAVIFAVSLFLGIGNPSYWPILTITAAMVGVLHGFIFWIIRRRQRLIRRKTLFEAQQMLKDVINNQLAVIQISHEVRSNNASVTQEANERMIASIRLISDALRDISEESLSRWHSKYGYRPND